MNFFRLAFLAVIVLAAITGISTNPVEMAGSKTWVVLGVHQTTSVWLTASSNEGAVGHALDKFEASYWEPDTSTSPAWIGVQSQRPTSVLRVDVQWHGQAPPPSTVRFIAENKEPNDESGEWIELPVEVIETGSPPGNSTTTIVLVRSAAQLVQKFRVECEASCEIADVAFNRNDLIKPKAKINTSKLLFGVAIPVAPRSPMYIDEVRR